MIKIERGNDEDMSDRPIDVTDRPIDTVAHDQFTVSESVSLSDNNTNIELNDTVQVTTELENYQHSIDNTDVQEPHNDASVFISH